jgi:hypothetical protein
MRLLGLAFIVATICCMVSSQGLTAWYNDFGPQVIYQNETTGDVWITIQNGPGNGTGPFSLWHQLPLTIQPKKGTPLASTGFTLQADTIQVSLRSGQDFEVSQELNLKM